MSHLILYIACSLDGYIARPNGSVDWLDAFNQAGGEDYGYGDLLRRCGAIIMGANTYRQVLSFGPWPYAGTPCYLLTHRPPTALADPLVRAYAGSPAALVRKLKKAADGDAPAKDIWLVGGAQTAGQFIGKGLVDEYIISIIPLLLGRGVPLWLETGPERKLKLLGVKSYPRGVVQVRYGQGGVPQ
jgi:dihydrofolate reductase